MNRFLRSSWEVVQTVVVAGAVVFLVRSFLFQPFLVSGASMEPNVQERNYLIIDELTYRFRNPERGEIIVFRYPGNPSTFYIKRIIGLPGEQIDISDGVVSVNGIKLDEAAYLGGIDTAGEAHATLGETDYFAMGDNRPNSYDSRHWGPLEKSFIMGRAVLRLYPLARIGVFMDPGYAVE